MGGDVRVRFGRGIGIVLVFRVDWEGVGGYGKGSWLNGWVDRVEGE